MIDEPKDELEENETLAENNVTEETQAEATDEEVSESVEPDFQLPDDDRM